MAEKMDDWLEMLQVVWMEFSMVDSKAVR